MAKKSESKFIRLDPETYKRLNHLKEQYRAPSFSAVISELIERNPAKDAIYLDEDVLNRLHALAAEENTDLSDVIREAIDYYGMAIERLDEIIDLVKRERK
ncbi:MAG: ribbon-helix-helix protein, CopG family [Desulfobacterales bacterium]|nr:ribbon-helix-helix protein, CopG family [Desulfobacterales bacterium]